MRHLRLIPIAVLVLALGQSTVVAQTAPPPPTGAVVKVKVKNRTNTVLAGIADEKTDMFTDPRFLALGVDRARRSVAWDTFRRGNEGQVAEIDGWINAAVAAGVTPLISFNRSRVRLRAKPTRAQWLAGFKAFRKRYPAVTEFVATNESNHTAPTHKSPKLAAQYYNDMRRACPTCKIAAATINERPGTSMVKWIRGFRKALGSHRPKYWAVHNYYGANTFSTKGTKAILKATRSGEIWITESGGLVKRRSNFLGKLKMREGLAHSTRAWRYIFDRMLRLSPRIKRIYLYHWNSSSSRDTWDSALIASNDRPRGGLKIVQARLKPAVRR